MTTTDTEHIFAAQTMASPPGIAGRSLAGYRIIIYGMNYAPEIAGVGKYTGELAEYFAAAGADVAVITTPPHYPGWAVREGYRNRFKSTEENGVYVRRTPLLLRRKMVGLWRMLAPLSFAITSAPIILIEVMRRRPHIVFCVEPTLFAAPVAQLGAWLTGAKIVLHVQDLEIDAAFAVGHLESRAWLKKVAYAFERATLRRFSKVITISDRMAERLVNKGIASERLAVVRNWVDLEHIYPLSVESRYRAKLGFTRHDFVVLYSGNIGAKQGLDVLLDAAERLESERNIHFVVAGEGPLRHELQGRYGHLPNLRFLPFQPYAELNEFLNMADLHALPQEKGAADLVLPSKLGGMLASGKPVIVTAADGTELAEFLKDAAVITPPGDAQRLAEGIKLVQTKKPKTTTQKELAKSLGKKQILAEFLLLLSEKI